jgi:adenosylcobinamide-phosphate synthase
MPAVRLALSAPHVVRSRFSPPPAVLASRALALLVGVAIDAVIADPRGGHPVALFGRAADRMRRRCWRDSRVTGALFWLGCVGPPVLLGALAERATVRCRLASGAALAAGTWCALGGTTLAREGRHLARTLEVGDLPEARRRLAALCARESTGLPETELARATIESLAENTSDAVVAPLLWGLAFGLPGVLGYRAVNTLDAMVGYRSPAYARFGWASARLDDIANLVPARLTGLLAAALAGRVGGSRRQAMRVLRRDGGAHPSPNAGRCEAAFAGALGIRLGGANSYAGQVDSRPALGEGAWPVRADVGRAVTLSRSVGMAAAGLVAAVGLGAVSIRLRRAGGR